MILSVWLLYCHQMKAMLAIKIIPCEYLPTTGISLTGETENASGYPQVARSLTENINSLMKSQGRGVNFKGRVYWLECQWNLTSQDQIRTSARERRRNKPTTGLRQDSCCSWENKTVPIIERRLCLHSDAHWHCTPAAEQTSLAETIRRTFVLELMTK